MGSHYGQDNLSKLRRLERAIKTRAKRKAKRKDIVFLQKC